jgi:predicted transcriptional regulator
MVNSLRRRVVEGSKPLERVPTLLKNVVKKPQNLKEWRKILKDITEAFYKRYWFYHPVKCAQGVVARRPVMKGSTEIYTCPGGTTQSFRRFEKTNNFFKFKYGRGGEFAQGLYAILKHGYGHKFPLNHVLGVLTLENEKGKVAITYPKKIHRRVPNTNA